MVFVLFDYCGNGDLSIPEAIETTQNIVGNNAIVFYKLDEYRTQVWYLKFDQEKRVDMHWEPSHLTTERQPYEELH